MRRIESNNANPWAVSFVTAYILITFTLFARLLYVSVIIRFDLYALNTAMMFLLLLGAVSASIWLALYVKSSTKERLRANAGAMAAFLAVPILLLELGILYLLILSALGIDWFPVPGSEGSEAALSSAIPQRFTDLLMIERFVK